MTKEEFEILVNEVLGRLIELSSQYSPEIITSIFSKCIDTWDISPINARILLLSYVLNEIKLCQACDRHKHRINYPIAEGCFDSIMLVGDYPNYTDNLTGKVFSGIGSTFKSNCGSCVHLEKHIGPLLLNSNLPIESNIVCNYEKRTLVKELPIVFTEGTGSVIPLVTAGQVLDRILLDFNLKRSSWGSKPSVYITNILLCPSLDTDGSNLPVTSAERKACKPWFELQLKIVKPKIIVCLGKEAYGYFYPKDKLSDNLGKLRAINSEAYLIGCTYHPGLVARMKDTPKADTYYKDITIHLEYYLNKLIEINNE